MNSRFLKYTITTHKAGLKHQLYNLKTLIYEAQRLGRIPIISSWHLFGYHNFKKGISTDFKKYFDLDKISIGGKHIEVAFEGDTTIPMESTEYKAGAQIDPKVPFAVRVFTPNNGCSWKFVEVEGDKYKEISLGVKVPYSNEVVELANRLSTEIGQPLTVVHVRRRDVLKKQFRLWTDTRPKNILKVLDRVGSDKNVYIMSNELKKHFFDKISNHYNLTTINDVEWLAEIQRQDNFMAFCIENQLLKLANKKVTTFSNNTDENWDGFLSKAKF